MNLLYQQNEEIKTSGEMSILQHTENLLFEIPEIEYNRTSSLEKTPKQIIWEISLPYKKNITSIKEIWEITEKLPSLTQLVITERGNE